MRASSEAALERARDRLMAAVTSDAEAARTIADELFAFCDLVTDQPKVAAALTDPTRLGADRADLAQRLLRRATPVTREVITTMAEQRWSDAADLGPAADDLGAQALAWHARHRGTVRELQAELFEVEEVISGHRQLRHTLGDRARLSADERAGLAHRLFADKVSPEALVLLERAVRAPGALLIASALRRYRTDVAAVEGATIATVRAAQVPTAQQLERLRRTLTAKLGREVLLNVAEEPELVGGMRVSVGSTIYDGTIRSALDDAQRQLAGKARA